MIGKNFVEKFGKAAAGTLFVLVGMTMVACNQEQQEVQEVQETPEDMSFLTEMCEHDADESCDDCMNAMLEYVKPSVVQVYCDIAEDEYASASGFIVEISEEDIYICSSRHVVEGYEDWQVYFHEGTCAQADIVGFADKYDVAVVSVPVSAVAPEVLQGLKTVYIDTEYWQGLGVEPFDVGLLRVDREGGVMHTLLGQVIRVKIDFPWQSGLQETELKVEQTQGDSGSAYFDSKGRLIAMVHGNSQDGGGVRNWGIPLDGIIVSYETITDRMLEL